MWFVTIADRIESTLQFCAFSTVIDQHPAIWALENGHDLIFAMEIPEDLDPKTRDMVQSNLHWKLKHD